MNRICPRITLIVLTLCAASAQAGTPAEFQTTLATEARAANPAFREFSARRGEVFYRNTHGGDWSCASCHTDDPTATGQHVVTKKTIQPIAPAANAERFTRPDKIEKWFKRNCNDVLKRACTPQEKGDFLAYLLSVK